ncbi:hypothetical protein ACFFRE_13045, partial [Aciditerrimonas ferrireducens]
APGAPAEDGRRRRNPKAFAAAAGAVLVAAGIGVGIGAAIAPVSPAAAARNTVEEAVAAAKAAGTYHYVQISSTDGTVDEIVGDATATGGTQVITTGQQRYTLRLIGGVVYFKGNASAVAGQLGASAGVAARYAGRWVAITAKNGASFYKTFEEGITTSSNLAEIDQDMDPTAVHHGTVDGRAVVEVTGPLIIGGGVPPSGTATLLLAAGSHRPLSLDGRATVQGVTITDEWTFSHYGESVRVARPAGAVPYARLGATPPASSSAQGLGQGPRDEATQAAPG